MNSIEKGDDVRGFYGDGNAGNAGREVIDIVIDDENTLSNVSEHGSNPHRYELEGGSGAVDVSDVDDDDYSVVGDESSFSSSEEAQVMYITYTGAGCVHLVSLHVHVVEILSNGSFFKYM